MDQKDFSITLSLMQMGLSEREAKVYRVLLGVSEITAAAIPKFTDVPRTKVYEVLNSLIKKGFCKEHLNANTSQTYSAIDPEIALNGIMKLEQERQKRLKEINIQLVKTLNELYQNKTYRLRDYDFVEVLKGRQEIIHRYTELRSIAKEKIKEFTKGQYVMSTEEMEKEADENLKLIKSGVQIKVIYETQEIIQEGDDYFHKKNSQVGVQARMITKLPIKMSLFDHSIIMLPLSDPLIQEPNITALVIQHLELYTVLNNVFNNYWKRAIDIT